MDSKRRLKHVFFFEWILKLSVLRKVRLLKIKEIKGYGGAPGSGNVKREMSRRKVVGCRGVGSQQVIVAAHHCVASGDKGTYSRSLSCAGPKGCWTRGTAQRHMTDTWDSMDRHTVHWTPWTDLHGTPWTAWIGTVLQFCDSTSWLPWLCGLLWQEVTWQWMENEWDNNEFILFCLFFCFLFITMFQWKKDKPSQFLVSWHSCFSVRHFLFGYYGYCYYVILQF